MIINRKTDWMGSSGPLNIIINDKVVGTIENNQSQTIQLKKGIYHLSVQAKFFERSRTIEVESNDHITIVTTALFKWFFFAALSIPMWGGGLIYNDNGWNIIGLIIILTMAFLGLKFIPAYELEKKYLED